MKKLLFFLCLLTIAACNRPVFSDTVSFEQNRWPRDQAPAFDFEIKDSGTYDVYVDFSHVYNGIPFSSVPMQLDISGDHSEKFDFELEIVKDGKHAGDCTGDYCDITVKVATLELPAGNYRAAVSQGFDHDFLPNVIRAGIAVRKSQ